MVFSIRGVSAIAATALVFAMPAFADEAPSGEQGRITQADITGGELTLNEIRRAGLGIFAKPFNTLDGYGDGPLDPNDTISPGGRPTLGGNGSFLRINGLDAQSCFECHSVVSNKTVPATLGVGGVGSAVTNALIKPTYIDPADLDDLDGNAEFNGRVANPPFIFGSGGVELLGIEMTADLQRLRQQAIDSPGAPVELVTKGVSFGRITADAGGTIDTSELEGIDADLVVKPFGRKGEFATTREFDVGAMEFHFGIQPVEIVGENVDGDGDLVVDEILVGELSALHVFSATMPRPEMKKATTASMRGFRAFRDAGCADCHRPSLDTEERRLPLRYPENRLDAAENVYRLIDLAAAPAEFERNERGGVKVPLFADLKRHDMGDSLAENFAAADGKTNREFTTARLWGVADTAPYMHDGRATTLAEAILMHDGEAAEARQAFEQLDVSKQADIISFLGILRTPNRPVQIMATKMRRESR
jgi:hypothetical protein